MFGKDRHSRKQAAKRQTSSRRLCRPRLEALEDRTLLDGQYFQALATSLGDAQHGLAAVQTNVTQALNTASLAPLLGQQVGHYVQQLGTTTDVLSAGFLQKFQHDLNSDTTNSQLKSDLQRDLGDPNLTVTALSDGGVQIDMHLVQSPTTATSNAPFSTGLLKLDNLIQPSSTGVQVQVGYDYQLDLGYDPNNGGIFFGNPTVPNANSLSVTAQASIASPITVTLGLLQGTFADKSDNPSSVTLSFAGSGITPANTPAFSPNGTANLNLHFATSVDTTYLPSITADFAFSWGFGNQKSDPHASFSGVSIDAGKAFHDLIGPVANTIEQFAVPAPIQHLVQMLEEPVPVLSDLSEAATGSQLKVIDLINALGGGADLGGLYDLINLVNGLDAFTAAVKQFENAGTLQLGGFDVDLNSLQPANVQAAPTVEDQTLQTFLQNSQASFNFKAPLLSDPANGVFQLLLGKDATLLEMQGHFNADVTIKQTFPILGILSVGFKGQLTPHGQFDVGFDTNGLRQFLQDPNHNPADIAQGLFVTSLTRIYLDAALQAVAALDVIVFHVEVDGGITGSVSLTVGDPKQPDQRLYQLPTPTLSGEVDASLTAILQVGVTIFGNFFGWEKDFVIASIPLLSFGSDSKPPPEPQLAHFDPNNPGRLILNMGFNYASLRMNVPGDQHPSSTEAEDFSVYEGVERELGNRQPINTPPGYQGGGDTVTVEAFGSRQFFAGVTSIYAEGGNGNSTIQDTVTIEKNVQADAEIHGCLLGSATNNFTYLGNGNARLFAGAGSSNLTSDTPGNTAFFGGPAVPDKGGGATVQDTISARGGNIDVIPDGDNRNEDVILTPVFGSTALVDGGHHLKGTTTVEILSPLTQTSTGDSVPVPARYHLFGSGFLEVDNAAGSNFYLVGLENVPHLLIKALSAQDDITIDENGLNNTGLHQVEVNVSHPTLEVQVARERLGLPPLHNSVTINQAPGDDVQDWAQVPASANKYFDNQGNPVADFFDSTGIPVVTSLFGLDLDDNLFLHQASGHHTLYIDAVAFPTTISGGDASTTNDIQVADVDAPLTVDGQSSSTSLLLGHAAIASGSDPKSQGTLSGIMADVTVGSASLTLVDTSDTGPLLADLTANSFTRYFIDSHEEPEPLPGVVHFDSFSLTNLDFVLAEQANDVTVENTPDALTTIERGSGNIHVWGTGYVGNGLSILDGFFQVALGNPQTESMQDIQSPVTIDNSIKGFTTLIADDSFDTTVRQVTLDQAFPYYALTGLSTTIIITPNGVVQIPVSIYIGFAVSTTVRLSGEANTVAVKGTPSYSSFTFDGGQAADVTVGNDGNTIFGLFSPVTVRNAHMLTLNDQGNTSPATWRLDSGQVSRTGTYVNPVLGIVRETDTVDYSNVGDLTINAGSGGNTMAVLSTAAPTLTSIAVGSGTNTMNVNATTGTLLLDDAGGHDTVTVASSTGGDNPKPVSLADILGPIIIGNNSGRTTDLTVDDSPDQSTRTWTVASSFIQGLAPAPIEFDAGLTSLTIKGSNGVNTVTVAGTPAGIATTIDGGAADDTFAVGDAAHIQGSLHFNGGPGNNTLLRAALSYTFAIPRGDGNTRYITSGPGGQWFTEFETNQIVRITPSGTVQEFQPIPTGPRQPPFGPTDIVAGSDGLIYFVGEKVHKIIQLDPARNAFTNSYDALPNAPSQTIANLVAGPASYIWFSDTNNGTYYIGQINTATGLVRLFPIQTKELPGALSVGPDGNLWFVETAGTGPKVTNYVSFMTPAGQEKDIPFPQFGAGGQGEDSAVTSMIAGPDGNLWATLYTSQHMSGGGVTYQGTIVKIDTQGHVIQSFAISAPPLNALDNIPTQIVKGPDGNLWFNDVDMSKQLFSVSDIALITPSGRIQGFNEFANIEGVNAISAGPDGIWFPQYATLPQGGQINDMGEIPITMQPALWQINSPDAGRLYNNIFFTGMPNLTGGLGGDTFQFQKGDGYTGSLSGFLTGGSMPATLDYSQYSGAQIRLAGLGTLHGFKGIGTGIGYFFDNIDRVNGAAFKLDDQANTAPTIWTITSSGITEQVGGLPLVAIPVASLGAFTSLEIDAGSGGNTFDILSTPAGIPLTINGSSAGNDTYVFGDSSHSLTDLRGPITLHPGSGVNSLVADASGTPIPVDWLVDLSSSLISEVSIPALDANSKDPGLMAIHLSSAAQFLGGISLVTGSQADNANIEYLPVSSPLTITGAGTGTITAGGDGGLDAIHSMVSIDTPSALIVDDRADQRAAIYTVTGTDVTFNHPPSVFWSGPGDEFHHNPSAPVTVLGGRGGNTFHVLSSVEGGHATSLVTGGNDTVNVGENGSVQGILGPLSIFGAGTTLVVDDSADPTPRTVTINPTTITGLAPAAITYSGVSNLTVDGGYGGNLIGVLNTAAGTNTTVNSGNGVDTVYVFATTGPLAVNTQQGGMTPGFHGFDTVIVGGPVGAAGTLNTIQGPLTINTLGRPGMDYATVALFDMATTTPETYMVTSNTIFRSGAAPIYYRVTNALEFHLGSGGNLVNIQSTFPGLPDIFVGGAGNDTFNVGDSANTLNGIQSHLSFQVANPGSQVILHDEGDSASVNYTLAYDPNISPSNFIQRSNSGYYILYSGPLQTLQLKAGAGNDAFNVRTLPPSSTTVALDGGGGANTLQGPNQTNTWQISGANAGRLDANIQFANVQNLVGGVGNDAFGFRTGGTLAGKLDGGAGINTLNYSAYVGDVTVDLPVAVATGMAGGIANIQNVTGSRGNDLLVGDQNPNVLIGGTGRNVIIGGGGSDQITGGTGDNLLIGGTTSYDTNLAALQAILKVWDDPTLVFDQRINALRKGTTVNGVTVVLDKSTVLNDGAPDSLVGGTGQNWFIVDGDDQIDGGAGPGPNDRQTRI
jgi:streptogramin lyase